jgi:hypothetical protein
VQHKYAVGQMVELVAAPRQSNRPSGPCRVLTCMPVERGPLQYRIQSDGESIQRVVSEADLRPSDAASTEPKPDAPMEIGVRVRK